MKSTQPAMPKITRPNLPEITPRTRLFRALDRARSRPVVWITGPPGAGKTTLVASYLAARRPSGLWYHMDGGDADPATFFYYLALAARKTAPRYKTSLPLLTPEYLPGLTTFTRRYFENLYGRMRSPFVLVFDNYHELPVESGLHDVIREGLLSIPDVGNVVVISRNAPPPSLARLNANRAMEVIGWDDLKLTEKELTSFVRLKMRKGLSNDAIHALHQKTEGWAAGVVLMLEHAKPDRLESLSTGHSAREAIFDYFVGETLDKTDARIRDFLFQTAFLPRITVRVAERMTGLKDAGPILSDLNRRNYFTIRLAEAEPTYQYHDLFREFLISRAKAAFSPAEFVQIQHRAASALEASGQIERAVDLYCGAGDWAGAVRLILTSAPSMAAEGRSRTLEDWIGRLPQELVNTTPWLLYWMGFCRLAFDPREGQRFFEKAFDRFCAQKDRTGILLSWSAAVDSYSQMLADFSAMDRWISFLEDFLRDDPTFPSSEVEGRVTLSILASLVIRQSDYPETDAWAERAFALAKESPDMHFRAQVGFYLCLRQMWLGEFAKAGLMMDWMREMSRSRKVSPLLLVTVKDVETMYLALTDSLSSTMQAVSEGLNLSEKTGIYIWNIIMLTQGIAASLSAGDLVTADRLFEQTKPGLEGARRYDVACYYYCQSWRSLLLGDTGAALEFHKASHDLMKDWDYGMGISHILGAQILHEDGSDAEARSHLSEASRIGRRMNSRAIDYMVFLTEAEIGLDGGRKSGGLEFLKKAFELGRANGIVNFFGWRSPVMARLCLAALEAGIETEFVTDLIRRRGLVPDRPPIECESWPWPVKIFTMGRFSVLLDGEPIRFNRKAQHKPLDLLKALIAFGGREVGETQLTEVLWPDAEGDAAHRAFATTLHRLRQLLGDGKAVVLADNRLSLDPRYCWVDVWAFERLLGKAAPDSASAEKAMALYQGRFMGQDAEPWTMAPREHLHTKFLRSMSDLGRRLEEAGEWGMAAGVYQRGLGVDPLMEEYYQRLMVCHQRQGHRAEAISVYKRCREVLNASLGIAPSSETEAIYRSVKASDTP